MIRVVHRLVVGRKLEVNVEKAQIVMFSIGSRSSREGWTTDGKAYEEVQDFKYLGVTFQRNCYFTRHHQEVLRRRQKRATEVWSLVERLLPDEVKVRLQMFDWRWFSNHTLRIRGDGLHSMPRIR